MRSISILGSTGSIGTQTLDVVRQNGDIRVAALAARSNIKVLAEQIREFHPKVVCIGNEKLVSDLKILVGDMDVKIVYGMEGLIEAATIDEADIVVTAVVGMMGIEPTIAAIKTINPMTKEALLKLIFCLIPTIRKAAIVPINEVMIHGSITSAGLVAFAAAR